LLLRWTINRQWTPSGDAFIIGSDLQRLESETLPQYFRHNRFQSLVRQLNFYSFRKINRERNVWIYKHHLFHRDRQHELHMVRRRTCPGIDGRKQRFSRLSAQRLSSKFHSDSANNSDAEDDMSSSGDETSVVGDKRDGGSFTLPPAPKRARSIMPEIEDQKPKSYLDGKNGASSPTSVNTFSLENQDYLADDSSTSRKYDRVEMMQQSLVVSEVASKLEEYVKKAMKEKGLSRTRRGRSGIVTPPFGRFEMNSSDLITYDDEYGVIDEGISLGVVSEEDETFSVEEAAGGSNVEAFYETGMMVAPVEDIETVKRVRLEILKRATDDNEDVVRACANVAAFFMLTAPFEDAEECCPKIIELLTTSRQLEAEFYFYRSALHPTLFLESEGPQGQFAEAHSIKLRNSLNGGADRAEALREFKVFSVNLIYKLLGLNGSLNIQDPLSSEDHSILLRTAKSWSKSVEIGA
jgi:hypothetical protein